MENEKDWYTNEDGQKREHCQQEGDDGEERGKRKKRKKGKEKDENEE